MPATRYRDYRDGDLDALAAVWAESWESMQLDIASSLATEQGCRKRIQRELGAGWRVIVAEENDRIFGFLATRLETKVLDQLFVSRAAKGRGLGTALLTLAMTQMPGGFRLRCAEANRVACAFYEKHGLRAAHTEPHPVLGHPTVLYVWPGSRTALG